MKKWHVCTNFCYKDQFIFCYKSHRWFTAVFSPLPDSSVCLVQLKTRWLTEGCWSMRSRSRKRLDESVEVLPNQQLCAYKSVHMTNITKYVFWGWAQRRAAGWSLQWLTAVFFCLAVRKTRSPHEPWRPGWTRAPSSLHMSLTQIFCTKIIRNPCIVSLSSFALFNKWT